MKKTLNINLAGYPFIIDEDAYNLLKDYLDTIRFAFETKDDTVELAADIESRVAEILIENDGGGVRIVSREEISKVIERIGKPSEFIEIDEATETHETLDKHDNNVKEDYEAERITPPPYSPEPNSPEPTYSRNPFARKKIFRDPENSMLGGVCSGLANYLHIDVTIVRLITVVLFFLSASTVAIAYIILWIVVPEARTPLQRMQMMGEDPTVENIGKTVTENYQKTANSCYKEDQKGGFTGFLSTVFSLFVKCLIILGLVIAIPAIVALGAGLLGCLIAAFVIIVAIAGGLSTATYGMFDTPLEGELVLFILLAVIGGIITVGVPLWLFIRRFWKKRDINPNPANRRALLIVWLCGIALVSVFSVKSVKKAHQIERWEIDYRGLEQLNNINRNDIEDIKINKEGVITIETTSGNYKVAKGKVIKDNNKSDIRNDSLIVEDTSKVQTKIIEKVDSIISDSIITTVTTKIIEPEVENLNP